MLRILLLAGAWLLCGLATAKIVWQTGHRNGQEPDGEDLAVLGGITLLWPLAVVIACLWVLGLALKAFITFDTSTWRARRKTQRIERELNHDPEDQ